MLNKFYKKHQALFIGLGIFALMMLAASVFSFGGFGNQHHAIYALSSWFSQHKLLIIFWHILLIVAIYWGWGVKVDLAAKRSQMDKERVKKLKRLRWVMMGLLLLIDLVMYL